MVSVDAGKQANALVFDPVTARGVLDVIPVSVNVLCDPGFRRQRHFQVRLTDMTPDRASAFKDDRGPE